MGRGSERRRSFGNGRERAGPATQRLRERIVRGPEREEHFIGQLLDIQRHPSEPHRVVQLGQLEERGAYIGGGRGGTQAER
jgi:hypothetical protein